MNPLTRYEPLVGRLDGPFNDFFRPALVWDNANAEPLPLRVDVRESAEAYVVEAELAGVKKEDIHVEIEGGAEESSGHGAKDRHPVTPRLKL